VHLLQNIVIGLSGLERYTESMALCRQYVAAVRSIGAEGFLPITLCLLSNTAYFTAEFDVMEMSANEALTLATSLQQEPLILFARVCLALVLAARGEFDTARTYAEQARGAVPATGMHSFVPTIEVALALADMGAGDWPAACRRYAAVHEFMASRTDVSGILHWRADEVESLWRSGDAEAARLAYTRLEAWLPAEGPWEQAAARRVAALLAGQADEAEQLFTEALRLHERCPSRFEQARTRLCFGEWLAARGDGVAAAEQLGRARDTFTELAARPWAGRADALLRTLPPREAASQAAAPDAPAAAPDTPVSVRAFGPLTLIRAGVPTPVAMDAPGRTLRYLVAAGGSVHVEQLTDALWPEAAPGSAGPRLRTVLSRARARYGPILVRSGPLVRWADGISVDAQRFADLARAALSRPDAPQATAMAREAVALYIGELMPQERYTDWAVAARERMRQHYLDLLVLLTDRAVADRELAAAIDYARTIVDTEPLDEQGYTRLARLQLEAGRRAQARETIARGRAAAATLGLPVSSELTALEQRVTTHEA
jgi:DNA-binding SARP family transcriptional activator